MEDQQAPTPPETRNADQELLRLFNEIAAAYQLDKQHQEAVDQRGHQLRLMTEQNRHSEATQWISEVSEYRKEHLALVRHQFDRQFWLAVALTTIAVGSIIGLIFLKNDVTSALVIFSLIVSYLAGRKSQNLFPAAPALPSPMEPKPSKPPQP